MSLDVMTEAQRDQAEARRVYLESFAAGDPITGAALAERFGRRELAYWGEDPLSAYLGPIAVDGLVTVDALALLAIHKARKES